MNRLMLTEKMVSKFLTFPAMLQTLFVVESLKRLHDGDLLVLAEEMGVETPLEDLKDCSDRICRELETTYRQK